MSGRGSNARIVYLAAILLLIPPVCPHLFALGFGSQHQKHDYKHEVEQMEEQWRVAQLAGDVATMDKLLSDDYVGISMTGQVNTKAQQLSRIKSHAFILTKIDLGDMKVKLVGEVAIVTVRAYVEGTNEGTPMNGIFRYTRVYQHLPNSGWKITNFEATRIPDRHLVAAGDIPPAHKPL